jgi:hypothetical protein
MGGQLSSAQPLPEARQVHAYLAESTVYSPLSSSLVQKEKDAMHKKTSQGSRQARIGSLPPACFSGTPSDL